MRFNQGRRDRVQSPCQGCGERGEGCHGSCERFRAYREARDTQYRAARETIRGNMDYVHYKYSVRTRQIRKDEATKRR